MTVLGIDIGSRTIAIAILNDKGELLAGQVADSGPSPLERAREMAGNLSSFRRVVATGYGRHGARADFATDLITEIKAHALGASHLFPSCRTVLDIGGQDSKVIRLDEQGRVVDFIMNDRCAAGTGKFLEIMAQGLGLPLEEMVAAASASDGGVTLNSMCTVFAESEVVSLLAAGQPVGAVARAVLNSICDRAQNLLLRLGIEPPVVFTGGVAAIPGLPVYFARRMGLPDLLVPTRPQLVGALGAALYGIKVNKATG
ncbi:putative CoA-substrate-specific enzyme activase [Desulfofundulus luciae]|uniref:CoA-substrate-specific enzyme activase n=1 Tax=Desulfofundulus luciae TaxID=74702 RepID=A0ABU0B3L0_9FIRM|nr:acyl-CoA dehydratase activase [Desulfofundulus luciae]MDQ0287088.1 putative CoA-substrate-specific enzyme activase [Desulfofundulus luciae]